MKLGEALTLRSDLQTRIERLRGRLKAAALVQEGEAPPEDPATLLALRAQADDFARERRELDAAIQETNWQTDLLEQG